MRLAGGFCLLLCGSLWGIQCSGKLRRQVALVQTLIKFFREIEDELRYGGTPAPSLLQRCREDERFDALDFLPLTLQYMREEPFDSSFLQALDSCSCLQGQPEALRGILREFGQSFGSQISEVEVDRTALAVSRLEQLLAESRQRYEKNGKMYRTLGVLGGLAAAIVIL
ncbi:stage III sporulation protein AB [Neobittarella massiliensis]|uniref:stage III sporulation protein AB n=1 Tax=Neobittarella massiliensis (ex Bilen et al. 2018) TaxID=2041842 RepID=UPI000CF71696|nr:stage III sporulation protein AB [Neobittarella massiliensis]